MEPSKQNQPGGQIHLGTQFGKVLKELASRPDLRSFLEVGTWNGRGSTECLMAGLVGRTDDWSLVSLEINPVQYATAATRWAGIAPGRLHLKLGRLGTRIMHPSAVETHPLVQPEWREWYAGEVRDFRAAPLVPLPPSVDCVLLDGGEFTTCGDWEAVQAAAAPRVVALDDTRAIKCAGIAAQLYRNPAWEVLGAGDERGGWAVFGRRRSQGPS